MSPVQNPIPGLILPGPQESPANVRNNNALIRWVRTVSPRMNAADQWLYSTNDVAAPAPPSDAYLIVGGVQSVSFAGGSGTLTLPQGFPNGILTAWAMLAGEAASVWLPPPASWTGTLKEVPIQGVVLPAGTALTGNQEIIYGVIGW